MRRIGLRRATVLVGLLLGFGVANLMAQDKTEDQRFADKFHAANNAAKGSGMMKVAMHTVSVETGLAEDQVDKLHKKYPEAGPAGVMMAGVIADETKQPVERFLAQNQSGKHWQVIAREHKIALPKLEERLDHLQKALATSETKPKEQPKR